MRDSRRDDHDIAPHQFHAGPFRSTELNIGPAAEYPQYLMRGAVIVMIAEDAVCPGVGPSVTGKYRTDRVRILGGMKIEGPFVYDHGQSGIIGKCAVVPKGMPGGMGFLDRLFVRMMHR